MKSHNEETNPESMSNVGCAQLLDGPLPSFRRGVWEFPVHHMRGGTSTGLVIYEGFAPTKNLLREELLRHLMGAPLEGNHLGNRQVTGLGRVTPTSNKVFFASMEQVEDNSRIVSTLAQLAADRSAIDWSVNCGNMSASLQLWAIDVGLLQPNVGVNTIDIRNTNTGVITTSRMRQEPTGSFISDEIPGVDGAFPSVDLFLNRPVGSKTGQLLPTGNPFDEIAGHIVSCVDVAVPMVIIDARTLGKTGYEPIADLAADDSLMRRLRDIWVEAGLRMGLTQRDGSLMSADDLASSETIPKVCLIAPPRHKGSISARYFTPQAGHASLAVSGGCCLAAAALIPGTIAHGIACGLSAVNEKAIEVVVSIENPAGILNATIVAQNSSAGLIVKSAAYRRSTQILLRGMVPLYRASNALKRELAECLLSTPT